MENETNPVHDLIAAMSLALNRSATRCGLNGDWSCDAWHVGPGEPNRTTGGVYILDVEDDDGVAPMWSVVRRWYLDEPGYPETGDGYNDEIEDLWTGCTADVHALLNKARAAAEVC